VPELPELQAHAERLDDDFAGTILRDFRPITFTALKTAVPDPAEANGSPLTRVGRRGKFLLLDAGPVTFVVHLMQGGRLAPDEKQAPKPRGGIARWRFADDRALLLTEPGSERKAGVWVVAGDPEGQAPLADLGPDADTLDLAGLAAILAANSRRLHGLLRDQHALAGIGRRLSNEICHRAKLSPFANAAKLDDEQVARLHVAMGEVIAESLTAERARDRMVNAKERTNAVHHRAGEACPVCGDTIRSVTYRAYEVDYCPTCQTAGKVLADNTTSRFLK
jgi:formamidopyrimidine-DNA glycosylase